MARVAKNLPDAAGDSRDSVRSLGQEGPLEEETATRSSILAWRIPTTEEPGESHGQRSLAGSSTQGHKESDTTE